MGGGGSWDSLSSDQLKKLEDTAKKSIRETEPAKRNVFISFAGENLDSRECEEFPAVAVLPPGLGRPAPSAGDAHPADPAQDQPVRAEGGRLTRRGSGGGEDLRIQQFWNIYQIGIFIIFTFSQKGI